MERVDGAVTATVGVITGVLSIFIDLFGVVFTVYIGLMVIDFITGLLAAWYLGNVKSNIGYKGLTKKLYTILLICAVYLIEMAVFKLYGVSIDGFTSNAIVGAFCVIEFVSIVENGEKMGKIPSFLKRFLSAVKTKVGLDPENKEEKNKDNT